MSKIVIIDTNIVIRYLINDDPKQNAIACNYLDDINIKCVLSNHVLCEIDWVLRNTIKIKRAEVINFFELINKKSNVIIFQPDYEIGMYFLKNGGDFADGIIAYQVSQFDNASLLTFDKDAKKIAKRLSIAVEEMAI